MIVYLISNNLLADNIEYDKDLGLEAKKKIRPLSIEGVKASLKIDINEITSIYSSSYVSSIETARSFSSKKNIDMFITSDLNDCKAGDLKKQSIKMLSFFQEHDFDFKQPGGESINECQNRIRKTIKLIEKFSDSAAIFLPRRAMFCYLTKYTDYGFNLEDRMVLLKNDKVIMESNPEDIEIYRLEYKRSEVLVTKID